MYEVSADAGLEYTAIEGNVIPEGPPLTQLTTDSFTTTSLKSSSTSISSAQSHTSEVKLGKRRATEDGAAGLPLRYVKSAKLVDGYAAP